MVPYNNIDNKNRNDSNNDNIKFEIINKNILVVQINRDSRRNAVDRDTADKLYDIFKEFNQDEELDVAILYGGKSNFSAGADLKEISIGNSNRLIPPKESDIAPMGCTRLVLDKPVICAINGYCVAGGLEMALWCDLRVCSSSSIFGVFCRRYGVPLIDGGSVRLPRLIGHSRAMDLILTGRPVTANEALQFGLVNRVVMVNNSSGGSDSNGDKVLDAAIELAKQISAFPKVCLRNDRQSAIKQWDLPFSSALENEFDLGYKSFIADGQSGSINFKNGQGRNGTFINNNRNNNNNNNNSTNINSNNNNLNNHSINYNLGSKL